MNSIKRINPSIDLKELLLKVEKPARYVGGEFGQIEKNTSVLNMAIAFPDLYEIGMSNQALKIIYNKLNEIADLLCERVFAPAEDFEAALEKAGIPLYTLESGIPLCSLDVIGFTLGYELGATGILSILKAGRIPLLKADRTDSHPIVVLGGPAASNPHPFSPFVDGVWIGEAEDDFFSLMSELTEMKRNGSSRQSLMAKFSESKAVWIPGKKAYRSIDMHFSDKPADPSVYPIPNMKIVQDHGAVEIMRGCPNGCRFCHAGVWYRPMRQKALKTIEQEVDVFIERGGYREISLSSLSSGDYSGIFPLVERLNEKYKARNISFQLPSLKVSSFSLPLLETISAVRKSGLTFAIETPLDSWQLSINKEVAIDNVVTILREAKMRGWKQAKFYFMVGLPVHPDAETSEEEQIVDFLLRIKKSVNLSINVNIGTFIPKPHTPYQWCAQITEAEAERKLKYIRDALRGAGFKVSTHNAFVSTLEGLISRGDERAGALVLKAFEQGCRLDAWEDHIRIDIWRALLEAESGPMLHELHIDQPLDAPLPWDDVNPGVGKKYLKDEYRKSLDRTLTSPCRSDCTNPCGSCSDELSVSDVDPNVPWNQLHQKTSIAGDQGVVVSTEAQRDPTTRRIIFSFTKENRAIFWPHLSLVEIFSKAFVRSRLPVKFSEGFNPLPKLDFAAPLSLGIAAENEIATIDLLSEIPAEFFIEKMNASLPVDIRVKKALNVRIPEGTKKVSAAAILWGFSYRFGDAVFTHQSNQDKAFRESLLEASSEIRVPAGLVRTELYAQNAVGDPVSYFEMYTQIYG